MSASPTHADSWRVVTLDPGRNPRWAALAGAHQSSVFASPAWCRVLSATYGFPVRAAVARTTDGAIVAGMLFAEVVDFLADRIVSLPFSDFCDPIVSDQAGWHRLIEDLVSRRRRIEIRCVDSDIVAMDKRFEAVGQAVWFGMDLGLDEDSIWDRIDGSARRAIRKADGAGVRIRVATDRHDLRAFYDLHLAIRKHKYHLLAQPYRFFEAIWDEFIEPGDGYLLLAESEGVIVGGILFLRWRDTLYYKFNASRPLSLGVRPNDRLLWEGIRLAKGLGLRWLDFGLSDSSQLGLLRYKRKYATLERAITTLRYEPAEEPAEREREGRLLLRALTDVLVDAHVPDDVTARAGDILYRYFC